MRRLLFAGLAFLVACSGGTGTRFAPQAADSPAGHGVKHATASLRVTIPRRRHHGRTPASISPLTNSIAVIVNGGTPQVFDTTPVSPNCSSSEAGTACLLLVIVPYGQDTITVHTLSGVGGAGSVLDAATVVVTVDKNTTSIGITLGPVVNNTNNSGAGSLRQAIVDARAGDTIAFLIPTPATIVLTGSNAAIALTKNLTIAGPGANGVTISGNGSSQLFTVANGVTATISGLTLAHGYAVNGGAIYNAGTLTVSGDSFVDNHTHYTSARPHSRARPLARARVSARGSRKGVMHGRLFPAGRDHPHQQQSFGDGGAIFSAGAGGALTVTGSTFSGNSPPEGYEGGAIYNGTGYILNIANSSFSGNSASYGGAVETDGPVTFINDTFTNNTGWPGQGQGNTAYGSGAAIHTDNDTTVAGCTFTGNVAGGASDGSQGYGGAITSDDGTLTITGSTFTNNVAGGGASGGSYGFGGAISYYGSGLLTVNADTFSGNKAGGDSDGQGGAIYSYAQPISGSHDVFSHNVAYVTGDDNSSYGGAIIARAGLTLDNTSFAANAANAGSASGYGYGNGGALDLTGTASLTAVTFTGNSATGGSAGDGEAIGGAVEIEAGTDVWTGVTFSGNSATASGSNATASGGAVVSDGALTVIGGNFDANVAGSDDGGYGGAIYAQHALIFRGSITNNTASTQGGGAYVESSTAFANATISGNHVTVPRGNHDGGAGIYNDGTLTLRQSVVSANALTGSAAGSGGGGMYNNGTASIWNTTFSENSSSLDGGGLENGGTATLVNVTLYRNHANAGSGGNLKNLNSDGGLSLANSIFGGGTAAIGPDVSNSGTATSMDYNILQTAVAGFALQGTTTHNLTADPLLAALANNGGPTLTSADSAGSPGYNAIPLSVCTSAGIGIDQRGQPRGDNGDGLCDVGAFELQNP